MNPARRSSGSEPGCKTRTSTRRIHEIETMEVQWTASTY
jgi:hypothetical protein